MATNFGKALLATRVVSHLESKAKRRAKKRKELKGFLKSSAKALTIHLPWTTARFVSGVFYRWPRAGWRRITRKPTGYGQGLPKRRSEMKQRKRDSQRIESV